MKKTSKKLLTLALTLIMALALAIPTFAAAPITTTITITGGNAGATYEAYRIMDLTTSDNGEGGLNYAYTINEMYQAVLQTVTGQTTEDGIMDYITAIQDRSDEARTFAESLLAQVSNMDADATSDNAGVFENVPQGYYLIVETSGDTTGGVVKSLVMLDTAGKVAVTVEAKEESMTLTKNILVGNDKYTAIDAAIGDTITFVLTSKLPENLALYENYTFTISDTMDSAFTEGTITSIKIGETDLIATDAYTNTSVSGTFTIDLTSYIAEATDGGKDIVVTYTAKLGTDAVIGSDGNSNTASLTFSNDPNTSTTTGTTPEDTVTVYTYQVTVNKVDGEGEALAGAGFTLYKKSSSDPEAYETVVAEITEGTTFNFKGLDAGEYKLSETTTPQGYNTADDIYFTISNVYLPSAADVPAMGDVGITVTHEGTAAFTEGDGVFITNVENRTGTELPSTGGIGTTLFYVVGGALVLGAAVLLITKKRVHDAED